MCRGAESKTISVDRSEAENSELLDRYGSDQPMMRRSGRTSVAAVRFANTHIRMALLRPALMSGSLAVHLPGKCEHLLKTSRRGSLHAELAVRSRSALGSTGATS